MNAWCCIASHAVISGRIRNLRMTKDKFSRDAIAMVMVLIVAPGKLYDTKPGMKVVYIWHSWLSLGLHAV